MSTYLLAFIVSEFAVRENVQKTFNVYSRPKAFAQTEYSFNIGQQLLAKLDEILDYKYYSVPEITKMSMAALPDFDAGGEFDLFDLHDFGCHKSIKKNLTKLPLSLHPTSSNRNSNGKLG